MDLYYNQHIQRIKPQNESGIMDISHSIYVNSHATTNTSDSMDTYEGESERFVNIEGKWE